MQASRRFAVALQIFPCVEVFKEEDKITRDCLAGSINTDPVILRKILPQQKSAGLIEVLGGTGGILAARLLDSKKCHRLAHSP